MPISINSAVPVDGDDPRESWAATGGVDDMNAFQPTWRSIMLNRFLPFLVLPCLLLATAADSQDFPVVDKIAQKLISKYQNATCEQLWQEKAQGQGQPKSAEEQRAIQILQQNPDMQAALFSQVATPIVTKMFQCGMIP
jgi:hypothetical protein